MYIVYKGLIRIKDSVSLFMRDDFCMHVHVTKMICKFNAQGSQEATSGTWLLCQVSYLINMKIVCINQHAQKYKHAHHCKNINEGFTQFYHSSHISHHITVVKSIPAGCVGCDT